MKFRPHELFLGVFLSVAVFAMGMMFSASYQTSPTTKNQSQQAGPHTQDHSASTFASAKRTEGSETREKQEDKGEFWSAKLTDWLLAILTGLLVLFTYKLWKSTDKLWTAGDDQYRLAKDISGRQASEIQEQLKLTRDNIEFARLEFNATHRPKLVIRETHMLIPTGRDPTAGVRLIVANSGVGTADIVESFVTLEFNEMGILLPLQYPDDTNSFGPLRI